MSTGEGYNLIQTDKVGKENFIKNSGNQYQDYHGISQKGLLKPFTTNNESSGIPHYILPSITGSASGFNFGTTSTNLNPFGPNTVGDGLIWGTGDLVDRNNKVPDKNDVRTFGYKNPISLVGWGYDVFGYPVPNQNPDWDENAVQYINGTGSPSLFFAGSGYSELESGTETSFNLWKAGPLDLRWDGFRGVWCGWHGGVQAGRILKAYSSGIEITDSESYYPDAVSYDVILNDGIANSMRITGVIPIQGPRPANNEYQIRPYVSGDFCFIVNHVNPENPDTPSYGIWLVEGPGTTECTNIAGGGSTEEGLGVGQSIYDPGDGAPWLSTGFITGSGLFAGLDIFPVPIEYGGLGNATFSSGDILIVGSGAIVSRTLTSGSGITLSVSSTGVEVGFSNDVAFVSAGINTTITELQGLTTPLTIGQGGTGATGVIFVRNVSGETIGGAKLFSDFITVSGGSFNSPGIRFTNGNSSNDGIFFGPSPVSSGYSLGFRVSGLNSLYTDGTGIFIKSPTVIETTLGGGAGLTIKTPVWLDNDPSNSDSDHLIAFRNNSDLLLGQFDSIGRHSSRFLHITGTPSTGIPCLKIEQPSSPGADVIEIYKGGNKAFRINEDCDTIYIGGLLSPSSYIRLKGYNNAEGGYIDLSANNNANGGYIDLSASQDLPGGYIKTSAGGGNIDTNSGFIELGQSGNRLTIKKPNAISGDTELSFPSSGNLATEAYVDNAVSSANGVFEGTGVTATVLFDFAGAGGEPDAYLIFVSGLFMGGSGNGLYMGISLGATGYSGGGLPA